MRKKISAVGDPRRGGETLISTYASEKKRGRKRASSRGGRSGVSPFYEVLSSAIRLKPSMKNKSGGGGE